MSSLFYLYKINYEIKLSVKMTIHNLKGGYVLVVFLAMK